MTIKNKACIVGIGSTEFSRVSGRSEPKSQSSRQGSPRITPTDSPSTRISTAATGPVTATLTVWGPVARLRNRLTKATVAVPIFR